MNKVVRWILIGALFLLLIAIRGFIAPHFYDPLNDYFKSDFLNKPIPTIEYCNYFLNLFLRYCLNSLVSLAIIHLIFQHKKTLIFSFKFFVLAFLLLSIYLFAILKFQITDGYILIFYVRRFLIQPLFVFILIPAFYYQKIQNKVN